MKRIILGIVLACAVVARGAEVEDLVKQSPAENREKQEEISRQILEKGEVGIKELCGMLKEEGGDAGVRFALHGVTLYAGKSGAETQRQKYTKSLGTALDAEQRAGVQELILHEIRLVGDEAIVSVVEKYLAHEKLCDPAAQVMVNVGSESSRVMLRKALEGARDGRRITIVKALGDLKDKESVPAFLADSENEDPALRHAALYALGSSGDMRAAQRLATASGVESNFERSRGTQAYVLLARRLVDAKDTEAAAKVCRDLLKISAGRDAQVQCAALRLLAAAVGASGLEELAGALGSPSNEVRVVANDVLVSLPGAAVTNWWIERSKVAGAADRAGVFAHLAQRGDKAALPVVIEAMKDGDREVRRAAIAAAGKLGGIEAMPAIISQLGAKDDSDRKAAREALARIPGDDATADVVAKIKGAESGVKAGLLTVLAARSAGDQQAVVLEAAKDASEEVRIAALNALAVLGDGRAEGVLVERLMAAGNEGEREAAERALAASAQRSGSTAAAQKLAASAKEASPAVRASMVRVMGRIGGQEALIAVRGALVDGEAAVREAAVRALVDWPDNAAAEDLLKLAKEAGDERHQALAIRGYVRMIDRVRRDAPQALAMLAKAGEAAKRADDKRAVLGVLAEIRDLAALKMAEGYLEDKEVKKEAGTAVVRIANVIKDRHRQESAAALEKVINVVEDEAIKKQATEALGTIRR